MNDYDELVEENKRLKEQVNLFAYELWEKERQIVAMQKRMMDLAEVLMNPAVFTNPHYGQHVDHLLRPYLNGVKTIGGVRTVEQEILPMGHLRTSGTSNPNLLP